MRYTISGGDYMLISDFCRDCCPYTKGEGVNICKVLDHIGEQEDCPAFLFAKYLKNKIGGES